jgi:hydrogenase nickel incorporation protein HypA/HybF
MHELSIARSLIEIAQNEAAKQGLQVEAVHIKVGALSGVVPEALTYAYDIATENTALAGTRLVIEEAPVRIYCDPCQGEFTLEGMQFACPSCGVASGDLRGGRELDIISLEVKD